MSSARTVLLIENDEQSARDIERFLRLNDPTLSISHTANMSQAASFIQQHTPDVVLLSAVLLNDRAYEQLNHQIRKHNVPLILLAETSGEQLEQLALDAGAVEGVVKNKINYFLLQKTIENILRLNKATTTSQTRVGEFLKQNESYTELIQQLGLGVLVVNSANQIAFANTKAYSIMAEVETRERLAAMLQYHKIAGEESAELPLSYGFVIRIRQSNINWSDEPATLFLLERKEGLPSADDLILNKTLLQPVIHNLTENIMLLKDERILLANQPALTTLNWKQNELNGRKIGEILTYKESTSEHKTSVASFFRQKEEDGEIQFADGSAKPVKFTMRPVTIADGFYHLLSFSLVEDKAEQNAPKSAGSSEILSTENVLYLASHDLREPVRTILNYLQLVSDKINSKKYEEATEFAAYAKSAASGMDRLLSDLKVYTALGSHPFTLSRFSMKRTMSDVMKQLKPVVDAAEAEISFGELPEVTADRQLVEKLLFHLIDNAVKFRRRDKKPVIDFGFDRFEGSTIFCVRDNGIGISKKHYQKIFDLFERLNRSEQYPGNGLGLAICKKITDMHGGELWVESLPGSGSNFYFTLSGNKV